jgi:hypothetical protein
MAKRPGYYIVSFETDDYPPSWRWELRRRGEPMGVKMTEGGYASRAAAEDAGKKTLASFLEALAAEKRLRG